MAAIQFHVSLKVRGFGPIADQNRHGGVAPAEPVCGPIAQAMAVHDRESMHTVPRTCANRCLVCQATYVT
eukprot:1446033-Amphidinium_carterae.1